MAEGLRVAQLGQREAELVEHPGLAEPVARVGARFPSRPGWVVTQSAQLLRRLNTGNTRARQPPGDLVQARRGAWRVAVTRLARSSSYQASADSTPPKASAGSTGAGGGDLVAVRRHRVGGGLRGIQVPAQQPGTASARGASGSSRLRALGGVDPEQVMEAVPVGRRGLEQVGVDQRLERVGDVSPAPRPGPPRPPGGSTSPATGQAVGTPGRDPRRGRHRGCRS